MRHFAVDITITFATLLVSFKYPVASGSEADLVVTIPDTEHNHRPSAGIKLCCLVTELHLFVNGSTVVLSSRLVQRLMQLSLTDIIVKTETEI